MQHSKRWFAALVVSGLCLSACAQLPAKETGSSEGPVKLEAVQGSDLSRVILTEKAAQRLDIKTKPVLEALVASGGAQVIRKVIPYSAVLYDSAGSTWTFINPQALVFVRHPIKVDYIDGDRAVLAEGPAPGTAVVTLGGAELYGAELGVE